MRPRTAVDLIDEIEQELQKRELPRVRVGDQVEVHYLISEGDKERVQLFIGTVIALSGRGLRRTVTVRRIVQGEGVERTFPLHSPRVKDITVDRRGDVRRAKLFYLRDRVGKKTRVKELLGEKMRRERAEDRAQRAARKARETEATEAPRSNEPEEATVE